MVWKSNLEENEQEFIEDFGAKTGDAAASNVKKPPQPKKTQAGKMSAQKNGSPGKMSQDLSDFNHDVVVTHGDVVNEGVGGSGEELA